MRLATDHPSIPSPSLSLPPPPSLPPLHFLLVTFFVYRSPSPSQLPTSSSGPLKNKSKLLARNKRSLHNTLLLSNVFHHVPPLELFPILIHQSSPTVISQMIAPLPNIKVGFGGKQV